jgi:general stress protein 26
MTTGHSTDKQTGPTQDEKVRTLVDLVADAKIAMLTTMTQDGRHLSRPMGLQEVEFDGDLWFFAYDDSNKALEIAAHPQVNVSFANPKGTSWTSIAGAAEIVHDRARAEKYWSPLLRAWFPDELDTPGLALIKVHAQSAEYWDGPSSKVVQLLGIVRAAVTRDENKLIDTQNEELDLPR